MATVDDLGNMPHSMNGAHQRDPNNNNCYGTLTDSDYIDVELPILDVRDFNERVIRSYEEGRGDKELPADVSVARSLVPAGTAALRDFSYVSPEIPVFIADHCTGCMECVTECPDTAILGKVLAESDLEAKVSGIPISDEAARVAASTLATPSTGWRLFHWLIRSLVPDPTIVD